MRQIACLLALLVSFAASAAEQTLPTVNGILSTPSPELRVAFDCFLNTNVVCSNLNRAFFDADRFSQLANDPEVTLEIRSWSLPAGIEQYELKFVGTGDLPVFKLTGAPLQIRASLSEQAKLQLLVEQLIKGISVFHRIAEYKTNPDGALVVTYKPSSGQLPAPNQNADSPLFLSAGAGANLASQGSIDMSGYAYFTAGVSTTD